MAMHRQGQAAPLGAVLRTGEGNYNLISERRPAAVTFNPDLATKLAYAELKDGPHAGAYLLWTLHGTLFIYAANVEERDPLRRVDVRQVAPNGGSGGYVTSLSYCSDTDDAYDMLIGYSTGEVKALSLAAQILAGAANNKPLSPLAFNTDATLEPSRSTTARCTTVAWVPGSGGTAFISAHTDGAVLLHHKFIGSSSDTRLLARSTGSDASPRPPPTLLRPGGGSSGVTAVAPSPSGELLALACQDGILRLLDLPSGRVLGGFKSYYGGLLCCAWSPDGQFLAAGGEDDLVAIWSASEGEVIAHCQGHDSWVSAVAFDSWPADSGACRVASVGQDCQLLLWDVNIGEHGGGGGFLHRGNNCTAATANGGGGSPGWGREPISPASTKAEMTILSPALQEKVHYEPLSDVCFTPLALLVTGHDGIVKKWKRPRDNAPME